MPGIKRKRDQLAKCKQCGSCCYYRIPLTLLDIQNLAEGLQQSPAEIMASYISPHSFINGQLYELKKRNAGACVFLNAQNRCIIHTFKPLICRLYSCAYQTTEKTTKDQVLNLSLAHNYPARKDLLWAVVVGKMITAKYIQKHGTQWHPTDFSKALNAIYGNIKTSIHENLKLARHIQTKVPICMLYNCRDCAQRGQCAAETPVTLLDINRIVTTTSYDWPDIFSQKLQKQPSNYQKIFKLKRDSQCVFFNARKKGCTIESVKPYHCRFTPCPLKTKDRNEFLSYLRGEGSVTDQFIHQQAMQVTRSYIGQYGIHYYPEPVEAALAEIEASIQNETKLLKFCDKIDDARFIKDAELIKSSC